MAQEGVSSVLTAQRDWLAAVRAKNIDGLMKKVTDDIAVIYPNGKTARGTVELRADFERFFGEFELNQSAVVEETVITGEWAFDISEIRSELIPINSGDPKRIKSNQDPDPYSNNQVRHFVGWFAAGYLVPTSIARSRLYREEGTNDPNNPDVALGLAAISMGDSFKGDYNKLAQDFWRSICGGSTSLKF